MTMIERLCKLPAWVWGGLGILALLVNWIVVGYLASQDDPASVHLWMPFAKHPRVAFGVIAILGALFSFLAARVSSRAWLTVAVINAATYLLEFVSS